nr:hypothetical protein [uncultured Lachnoclostridium sp.]
MKKYKEKYKPGMIFRSKKYHGLDFVIDCVQYRRGCESAYNFNMNAIIGYDRIDEESFMKYVSVSKGVDYNKIKSGEINTFPYPFHGEVNQKSMDAYIRKYEMEFSEMSDKEVVVFHDDDFEYFACLKEENNS